MKKILIFITAICISTIAIAHTINWHDGNTITQTTCTTGNNITPPTPLGKYGYHLKEWARYTQIEFLESTGTQYINTGVVQADYRQNLIVKIDLQFTELPTSHWQNQKSYSSGCVSETKGDYFFPLCLRVNGMFSSNVGKGGTDIDPMRGDLNKHKIICDTVNATLTIDNQTFNYNSNIANINENIHLFSAKTETSYSIGKVRIYTAKFLLGDNTIIRDFIPVLDKEGIPCLYDKVENKFYYNQGTGDFIAGPVVGSSGGN